MEEGRAEKEASYWAHVCCCYFCGKKFNFRGTQQKIKQSAISRLTTELCSDTIFEIYEGLYGKKTLSR